MLQREPKLMSLLSSCLTWIYWTVLNIFMWWSESKSFSWWLISRPMRILEICRVRVKSVETIGYSLLSRIMCSCITVMLFFTNSLNFSISQSYKLIASSSFWVVHNTCLRLFMSTRDSLSQFRMYILPRRKLSFLKHIELRSHAPLATFRKPYMLSCLMNESIFECRKNIGSTSFSKAFWSLMIISRLLGLQLMISWYSFFWVSKLNTSKIEYSLMMN
jgi:hypothetical protein